jgi:hypothetical protein
MELNHGVGGAIEQRIDRIRCHRTTRNAQSLERSPSAGLVRVRLFASSAGFDRNFGVLILAVLRNVAADRAARLADIRAIAG